MRSKFKEFEARMSRNSVLRALGLRLDINKVESLEEYVILLIETCGELSKETVALRENVEVLGRMAHLMRVMTDTMARYSHQESGVEDEEEIELLTDGLDTLRDVAGLMFDMSKLMAQ